jgi:hypothetical protein
VPGIARRVDSRTKTLTLSDAEEAEVNAALARYQAASD